MLTHTERILFASAALLFVAATGYLAVDAYRDNTVVTPAHGGSYHEGIQGELRQINPVYASSETERDVVQLLFEGLLTHTSDGELTPELATGYTVNEDRTQYTFTLRRNARWSDGDPITAEDIVWTISVLKDPAYQTGRIAEWLNVTAEKLGPYRVRFTLEEPYYAFPELATTKILPKHIWQDVPPQNFHLSPYNVRPVTSGPYTVKDIAQDDLGFITEMDLAPNPHYYGEGPYITDVALRFFDSRKKLLEASSELDGFSTAAPLLQQPKRLTEYTAHMPRYFALFFNQESAKPLVNKSVRNAIRLAIDKQALAQKALNGNGSPVHSPFPEQFYTALPAATSSSVDIAEAKLALEEAGYNQLDESGIRYKDRTTEVDFRFTRALEHGDENTEVRELQKCLGRDSEVYSSGTVSGYFGDKTEQAVVRFQEKYAESILQPAGLEEGTGYVGESTREKLNELCARTTSEQTRLQFELVTVKQEQMLQSAETLQNQLREIGIQLDITALSLSTLSQERIKSRQYDILLFGHLLNAIPDPYTFWHSDQTMDPGLNLAQYTSERADELIVAARRATSQQEFATAITKLRRTIRDDIPAIFLYTPDFRYFVRSKVKGISVNKLADPAHRFTNIEKWFIKTKRVWK